MTKSVTPAPRLPQSSDPNIPQQEAATPDYDVWVAASAGSGKTKVLTDRVLRLLLPDPKGRWEGCASHRILCITFTKAAAALMALKVQSRLAEWAVMNDAALYDSVQKLVGEPPSDEMLQSARKLFAKVLDVPGGLSIMTIHSFCQSVLGRFAIEAGISPGFTVLDDARSSELLKTITDALIRDVETGRHPELKETLDRIATYMDLDGLRSVLLAMTAKSRELTEFLNIPSHHQATGIYQTLLERMSYNPDCRFDIPDLELRDIAVLLEKSGGKRNADSAAKIATWLAAPEMVRAQTFGALLDAFLTQKGTPRNFGVTLTQNAPDVLAQCARIVSRIQMVLDNQAIERQAGQTSDMLEIIRICLDGYAAFKKERNALDFGDLILKTRTLLESQHLDWVHYKLDEGIDHILVDEAQDTNIHQWEIIRRLSEEFLSGQGNESRRRSLFVVGDGKQSIFSFHGAAPDAFRTMREFFHQRSESAGRDFRIVPLETSFRSARPVLELVDTVFENPAHLQELGLFGGDRMVHYSYRDKAAGLVELWPLTIRPKVDTRKTDIKWALPPVSSEDVPDTDENKTGGGSPLASQIAQTIWGWIEKKEILTSRNRPIEPRDILILVRTRSAFVGDMVRHLKLRGVPVSGVDRIKLSDQIAIQDCLAMARFARYPADDLSLACLLKSPFIRMEEDTVMNLALRRPGTLWDVVQEKADRKITDWLLRIIAKGQQAKPFDFFDDALNGLCPYHPKSVAVDSPVGSGWRAFAACLGPDSLDPLDEFLSYCLTLETEGVFSIEDFILRMSKNESIIKRDTETNDAGDGPNQVRIMTVHASKGLEAPVVILPDTTSVPSRGKIDALQWIDGSVPAPLWAARSGDGCALYAQKKNEEYARMMAEYRRLLYVALTRPQDRLYVMGESASEKPSEESWYSLVSAAFQKLPDLQKIKGPQESFRLRYETTQQEGTDKASQKTKKASGKTELPDWVYQDAPEDAIQERRIIRPSRLDGAPSSQRTGGWGPDRVLSPLEQRESNRFRRGVLTHKLFQILPGLPPAHQEMAARRFLLRTAPDISTAIQDDIIKETLTILHDAVFAEVFGENSLAEVPISGDMGGGLFISGQIDRLVIGHKRILIVDFKTNRPSPAHIQDVPDVYINQLKAYKTALLQIYPDKEILCALLWTDKPFFMPVSV